MSKDKKVKLLFFLQYLIIDIISKRDIEIHDECIKIDYKTIHLTIYPNIIEYTRVSYDIDGDTSLETNCSIHIKKEDFIKIKILISDKLFDIEPLSKSFVDMNEIDEFLTDIYKRYDFNGISSQYRRHKIGNITKSLN